MLEVHDFTTAFDRSFAWALYLGSAVLVLAIMAWVTHRWQRDIRLLLLALLAVAMFLPAPIPGHESSAPAFIFIVLGLLSGNVDVIAPVLVRFSLAGIGAVVVVIAVGFWWRHLRHKRAPAARSGSARRGANR